MLRRTGKQSNTDIKKEREAISQSISVDKKNLEKIVKQIKQFKQQAKEKEDILLEKDKRIESLNKVIQERNVKIEDLENKETTQRETVEEGQKEIKSLETDKTKIISDTKIEQDEIIESKKDEKERLDNVIVELNADNRQIAADNETLVQENKDTIALVEQNKEKKKEQDKKIDDKISTMNLLDKKIDELTPVEQELRDKKQKKEKVSLEIKEIQKEQEQSIGKFNKDIEEKGIILVEKEKKIKKIDNDILNGEQRIKNNEVVMSKQVKERLIKEIELLKKEKELYEK